MDARLFIAGFMFFVLIFGCINITQTQETPGVQQPVKPPKQPGPTPPQDQGPTPGQQASNDSGTADTGEEDEEDTAPGTGITIRPLMNYTKNPEITIHKNKTINVDLYTFLNKTPDFSGLPKPTNSQQCRDECDDYCEDDKDTCMDACGFSWNNLCANAAAAAGVCQASCAAIPFPWLISDCIDTCQDEFEDACNTDDLHDCQNHCAGDHYDLCIDLCYEHC